jgi:hypothetical protein
MSFGFGISDIALLIQLAWSTFDGAKRACGEHDDLTKEVLSLHSILNHLHSEVRNPDSLINLAEENRRTELHNHLRGCGRHLRRMNSVITKFNALPDEERSGRQLWQRIRFGSGAVKDVADIRLKMSTYTTAISITMHLLSLGSQGRVERRLIRQGGALTGITESINLLVAKLTASSPESSIMTTYLNDDKSFWRALRRELVEDGYPSRVIQGHKDLIQDYVRELGARGVLDDSIGRSRISLSTYADIDQFPSRSPGPFEPKSRNSTQVLVEENVEDTKSSQGPVDSPHEYATEDRAPEIPTCTSDPVEPPTSTNAGSSNVDSRPGPTRMTPITDSNSTSSQPAKLTNKGKEKESNGPRHYMGIFRADVAPSPNWETFDDPQGSNGRHYKSALANLTPSQEQITPTEIPKPQPVQPLNQNLTADTSEKAPTELIECSKQPKLDIAPSSPLAEYSAVKEPTDRTESSDQPNLGIPPFLPMTVDISSKNSPEKVENSAQYKRDSSPSSPLAAEISGMNLSEHVECSIQSNSNDPPSSPSSPMTPEIIELLERIGSLDEIIQQQQAQIEESTDMLFINPELSSDKVWDSHLEYSTQPYANNSLDSPLVRNMIKLSERIGYLEELSRLQREFLVASHIEHPKNNKEESDGLQATVSEELEVLETANSAQEAKEKEGAIAIISSPSDDLEGQKKMIYFKDAVGRKFTFPFNLAATWAVRLQSLSRVSNVLTVMLGDGGAYQSGFLSC